MNRRQSLLAIGSVVIPVTTTGCLGFITGSESLTFEATQGTVSPQVLTETGYEENTVRSETLTRPFSVAGQEREVEATNWIAQYTRTIEVPGMGPQELAMFVVLATPQVNVLNQTFNPIGDMSNRELLQEFQSNYQGFQAGNQVDTHSVPILGESREIEKFQGTATFNDQNIDLFVHITTIPHNEDYVVALGVYPQVLRDEEQRIFQLYQGIQH